MSKLITKNDLKAIFDEILPWKGEDTPEITVTNATGTATSVLAKKYGNVLFVRFALQNSSSTASGSNFYSGTIDQADLRPTTVATGGTYYGAYPLMCQMNASGAFSVRNCSASSLSAVTGSNYVYISLTYFVD